MADLKNMTFKEKREYIWDYYKIHIIAGIFLIAVIGSIIHDQVTKVDTIFNLTLVGNSINYEKSLELQNDITSLLTNNEDKKKQAFVGLTQVSGTLSSQDAINVQVMQKLMAQISVKEIDLIVMDKSDFDKFAVQGTFMSLDNLPELKEFSDKKLFSDSFSLNVENNKKLKDIGFDTKNKVVGILANTQRKDYALKAIKWLVNE